MERKPYRHLTYEQRCQIYCYLKSGMSYRLIAKHLGVHHSTIYREVSRNQGSRGYRYDQAHRLSHSRRCSGRKKLSGGLLSIVKCKLAEQWSPEQITGWMRKHCSDSVSHELIYQYIWDDKRHGGSLYKQLRHSGKKYHKRKGKQAGRGCIPNRIDIEERPSICLLYTSPSPRDFG